MELEVGHEIKNYRLLKKIGDGASGEVWHARDLNTPRDVALKLMHLHLATSAKSIHRERFIREANAVRTLGQHPNIPTFYDEDLEFTRPYFVMEYIRGEGVDNMIYDRTITQISHTRRVEIICQIGDALGFAHREGYVHRDIKPSNVKIIGNDTAYLLDFSVAFEADDTSRTQLGIGTPLYMPPEIFPSKLGDIFSLALVSFEILYAEHPIFMDTDIITTGADAKLIMDERLQQESWKRPSQLAPLEGLEVDYRKLDAVYNKAFAHNPSLRYQSANQFCDDLQNATGIAHAALDGTFVAGKPVSTVEITGVIGLEAIDKLAEAAKSSPLVTLNVSEPAGVAATNILPDAPVRNYRPWLIGLPILLILALLAIGFFVLNQDDDNSREGGVEPTATSTETATLTLTPTDLPTETAVAVAATEEAATEEAATEEATEPVTTAAPIVTEEPATIEPPTDTPTEIPTEPVITPAETELTTPPTATVAPTVTLSPTPELLPSTDLAENLTQLYSLASNVDEYPCPYLNLTYEYIQAQRTEAGSDHAEYAEQLTGTTSAMARIYNRFCRAQTNDEQPLPAELEEFNDELLDQLQLIVEELGA